MPTALTLRLCSQIVAMLFVFFRIVGAGVSVVASQALGGGRRDAADRTARATLGASSWIGGVCGALAVLGAGPLLRLMNAPPEVLPLAVPLLQCLAPGVLLDAWNTTLASVLRSLVRSRPTMLVNVANQMVHLLALPLMLGLGPLVGGVTGEQASAWPGWGLLGYAAALFVARSLGLLLFLQCWRQRLGLTPKRSDWWRLPRHTLAPVLHIGLPGAAENIAWRAGFMFSIAVVG